mgnify:CR=1 FL=1
MELPNDRLGWLGAGVGAYLALAGLAIVVGMPWQHGDSTLVTVGQVVGALATVAVGAGLAWLVTR